MLLKQIEVIHRYSHQNVLTNVVALVFKKCEIFNWNIHIIQKLYSHVKVKCDMKHLTLDVFMSKKMCLMLHLSVTRNSTV